MTDSDTSTASLDNIIPDELRQIIGNLAGENITGANHLTRTTAGQVVTVTTPSGQAEVVGMDLNQIALNFDTKFNSLLAADVVAIPEGLLGNSPTSVLTNPFTVDALGKAKVFTADVNPGQSFYAGIIRGASLGAAQYSFVDADDADNLIEIEEVDAAQSGGLRAWGGNDQILGTEVNDIVNGNGGSDKIVGAGGHDMLQGGQGNDVIAAGEGDDLLLGNKGDDFLYGGLGNDVIGGGKGVDVLMGNAGNDILIGGTGEGDFLMGSAGADQFILRSETLALPRETLAMNAAEVHQILDFNPLQGDLIKIAYFDGTQALPPITFAGVDVNLDTIQDTAIVCSNRVVGVVLGLDPTQAANLTSSILMVDPKDTALSTIGGYF